MAKNIKKRLIGSYRTKTKKTKRSQNKGLEIGRQRERLKTGEVENFPIQEYQRDIIQFSEKEVFLPEKKEQLIKIETWEREVFTDCFYKNRPRLILISLAKKNGKSTFSAMVLNWFLITHLMNRSGSILIVLRISRLDRF